MSKTQLGFLTVILVAVIHNDAIARDLVSAANTYTQTAKTVAQAVSIGGVMVGGIMFAIPGLNRWALSVFSGGLAGVVITYGAQTLVSLASNIFGG